MEAGGNGARWEVFKGGGCPPPANWPTGQLAIWPEKESAAASRGNLFLWPTYQLARWPVGQSISAYRAALASWRVGRMANWPLCACVRLRRVRRRARRRHRRRASAAARGLGQTL